MPAFIVFPSAEQTVSHNEKLEPSTALLNSQDEPERSDKAISIRAGKSPSAALRAWQVLPGPQVYRCPSCALILSGCCYG